MGRRRKDGNPLGLEPRVEAHHGQFRYLHRDGRKESLGKDVARANARARIYNDPEGRHGSVGYFLDLFLAAARAGRLPAGWTLAERTIGDYEDEAELYKLSPLGKLYPADLVDAPNLIAEYRDRRVGADGEGQVQANHALSLLSSTFRWLIETGEVPGLVTNPVKLIRRFPRQAKDRYVEDSEYAPVYSIAVRPVCMALRLAYTTLQRPADLLRLSPGALRVKAVAGQERPVLTVIQGKTGRTVDIAREPELEQALYMLAQDARLDSMPLTKDGKVRRATKTLVHAADGSPYTEDGLHAMLRRYCLKAGVKPFGLMDVRAKGATDMYLRGVPLEVIQMLMGHASVKTTEIYIKRLLQTVSIASPNRAQA